MTFSMKGGDNHRVR